LFLSRVLGKEEIGGGGCSTKDIPPAPPPKNNPLARTIQQNPHHGLQGSRGRKLEWGKESILSVDTTCGEELLTKNNFAPPHQQLQRKLRGQPPPRFPRTSNNTTLVSTKIPKNNNTTLVYTSVPKIMDG
jgi:hypothetical protein